MKNSFYTSYKVFTHHGHITQLIIAAKDHIPFAHYMRNLLHSESSHHRIFHVLTAVRRYNETVIYTERKYMNSNGLGNPKNLTNLHKEC